MKTIMIKARYPWWHTRRIHFSRYWPFITICCGGTCMCDINEILKQT